MSNGIYVALAGAITQAQALDVVSNNVANASTTGYRAVRVNFGEALTQAKSKDQHFSTTQGTTTDETPGTIMQTGNPLDVALRGEGYFSVNTPQGVRWTRSGELRLAADGRLTTADGKEVRGVKGKPITVPLDASEIVIGADGSLSATSPTGEQTQLGKMELARFDPRSMTREGATLYRANAAPIAGAPEVAAGALESSNINVVRGMVDLIRVSRTYEALHSAIQMYKEVDQRTVRELGGPQ